MIQMVKFIFGLTFFLASASVQASSIISVDGNVSFKSKDLSDTLPADQFLIANADDAYISYNSFSDFVVDQPLQIFNLPNGDKPAADLIVIQASNVVLRSSIEVIGPKTDILIFENASGINKIFSRGDGDGEITCISCSFNNVNRITLGSGLINARTITIATTGNSTYIGNEGVGEIRPTTSSKLIVNGLFAPGALSLELAFSSVENSGLISLNQSLSGTGIGLYNKDVNGSKKVGTGTVNIFMGSYRWDYDQRIMVGVSNVIGTNLSLGGKIEASNVRILSSFPLTVDANIDTITDLLATTMYRGNLTIVDENVTIETVKESTASLNLVGNINTEGSINLNSAHEMSISSYSDVNAGMSTAIVTANAFYNFGDIHSQEVTISAGSIANEGNILAKSKADIFAIDFIFNQYGGLIQSQEILLESEAGIVRNGSKTPYKDTSSSTVNTLISYSTNYIDELSSVRSGAFYQSNVNTSSDSLVLAPVTTASISGNKVQVLGAAFENINPYYVFSLDGQEDVDVDVDKAFQVSLKAADNLTVDVDNYILNSSAIMEMNNAEGLLTLVAPLINNERYRLQSNLTYSSSNGSEILAAETVVYSLPALMLSLGDVRMRASQSVLNNTSYMEVFGDLSVDSPTVSSLGYELSSINTNGAERRSRYDVEQRYSYGDVYASLVLRIQGSERPTISTGTQLDTLFFVDGTIYASQATGWFRNNKPLTGFVEELVEQRYENYNGTRCFLGWTSGRGYETVAEYGLCSEEENESNRYYLDQNYTYEISEETNELILYHDFEFLHTYCHEDCSYDNDPAMLIVQGASRTIILNLFEQLELSYDLATGYLADLYEEIKFW